MPTAITIGPEGKIYVTDSRSHNIHVFDPAYISLGTIGSQGEGEAELDFPTDSIIVNRMVDGTPVHELYVTDQGNNRIQIYDLQGNYLSAIYGLRCGWKCPPAGTFNRVQAIEVDSLGRLHILDIFEAKVAIVDPITGDLLGSYGDYGKGPGLLKVPVDLLLTEGNTALVTDGGSDEVEVFAIP
jgi:DNA-binding beta-propeller fold protein YncE